eukprot:gene29785-51824_t
MAASRRRGDVPTPIRTSSVYDRSMRIAAVQHDIVWNDREANFERLAPRIRGAAASGARLVLLSETYSTGFAVDAEGLGEPEGGPSATFLMEQAREHDVWVGGSCPELGDDGDPRPHGPGPELRARHQPGCAALRAHDRRAHLPGAA